MHLRVKIVDKRAVLPIYSTKGASGFDLLTLEEVLIASCEWKVINTGLAFEVPSGYEIQIRSRSGVANRSGLVVLNQPGTLDSDYRGELKLILLNLSSRSKLVTPNARVAQAVVCPVERVDLTEVEELSETERGEGGLGSTDRKGLFSSLSDTEKAYLRSSP